MQIVFFTSNQKKIEHSNTLPCAILEHIYILFELSSKQYYNTVNQQILTAIKFGVSQNKVIWQLLNLASPHLCSVRSTYDHVFRCDKY